jgi:geranyl-CoA carboxylase alpha subunit
VAAVKAIRYEGAGTVEFLLDASGEFHFMEMNTRLQVEHPVTEAITGLDLVELQLRIASGEPLPLTQDDVRLNGHAIEVRLCAEDVARGFIPQSGTMTLWDMPDRIRVEHALESGAHVSPYYDSMIAKLIGHGASREEARRKLRATLEDAVALGVRTNQTFLTRCLDHRVFAAGEASTAFVERHGDELLQGDSEVDSRAHALGAALLYATAGNFAPGRGTSSIAHRLPIAFRFDSDAGECHASLLNLGDNRYSIEIGERVFALQLIDLDVNRVRFACDGLLETAAFIRADGELLLQYRGNACRIQDQTHVTQSFQGDVGGDGRIRAAMNGRVVAVHVAIGDEVKGGQPVITLEAMKMEHVHAAPIAGRVASVNVAMGDQVAAYRIVAEIEGGESARAGA